MCSLEENELFRKNYYGVLIYLWVMVNIYRLNNQNTTLCGCIYRDMTEVNKYLYYKTRIFNNVSNSKIFYCTNYNSVNLPFVDF